MDWYVKVVIAFFYGIINVGIVVSLISGFQLDINAPLKGQALKFIATVGITGLINYLLNEDRT